MEGYGYKERIIDEMEMFIRGLKKAQADVEYYQIALSVLTGIMDGDDIPEDMRDFLDSVSYGG